MDKLAEAFQKLAEQYGPKVAQSVLTTTEIDGFSSFAHSAVFLVLALAGAALIWKVLVPGAVRSADSANLDDCNPLWCLGCVVVGFGSVVCAIASSALLDPWTYVHMTRPDLWLAHLALAKIGS